jgi:hypothetical protein
MKRSLAALVAGVVLGGTGVGMAARIETWHRNSVFCFTTGRSTVVATRGVGCRLDDGKKLVVINHSQIVVSNRGKAGKIYFSSSP